MRPFGRLPKRKFSASWDVRPARSVVLSLIDVVMIATLLVMVIVGGYETFLSRLNLKGQPVAKPSSRR